MFDNCRPDLPPVTPSTVSPRSGFLRLPVVSISSTIGIRHETAATATPQVDPNYPELIPAQSLTGWRREFCVELLGDGGTRIFVRAVEWSSLRATELQRAVLFHRVDSRFRDLEGCVEAIRPDLVCLVDAARRTKADKGYLFASVEYDRAACERVQLGVDRWMKR